MTKEDESITIKIFRRVHAKTEVVRLPAFLSSALVMGDDTGIDDIDDHWVEAAKQLAIDMGGHYTDVQDVGFSRKCDLPGFHLGADMADYTILIPLKTPGGEVEVEEIDFDLEEVTNAFLEAALFTATDDEGNNLDRDFSVSDFSTESALKARGIVRKFLHAMEEVVQIGHDESEAEGKDDEPFEVGGDLLGNDIWYSSQGHGVGFFDRPELYGKKRARQLQELARKSPSAEELHVFANDNGELDLS